MNLKLIDQRTVQKNIERGLLTEKEYQDYLKSLPDDADSYDIVTLEDEEESLNTDAEGSLQSIDEQAQNLVDELLNTQSQDSECPSTLENTEENSKETV